MTDYMTHLIDQLQDPEFAAAYTAAQARERKEAREQPWICVDPARRWGDHTIRDSRLPVWAVVSSLAAGESVDEVADDYNITRADVLCACWYVGMYGLPGIDGARRWQRALREWAKPAGSAMWHAGTCDYAAIPDPPLGPDEAATR